MKIEDFMMACREGRLLEIKTCLEKDAELDLTQVIGFQTAMRCSITADQDGSHKAVIDALFACDRKLGPWDYHDAMVYYAERGDLESVKHCIEYHKCDPNYVGMDDSALVTSVTGQKNSVVDYLLNLSDINVNLANQLGESPLIIAIKQHNLQNIQTFLRRGDVNLHVSSDVYGSPLTAALICLRDDLGKYLVREIFEKEGDAFDINHHPYLLQVAIWTDNNDILAAVLKKIKRAPPMIFSKPVDDDEEVDSPAPWVWQGLMPDMTPFAPTSIASPNTIHQSPLALAIHKDNVEAVICLLCHGAALDERLYPDVFGDMTIREAMSEKIIRPSEKIRKIIEDLESDLFKNVLKVTEEDGHQVVFRRQGKFTTKADFLGGLLIEMHNRNITLETKKSSKGILEGMHIGSKGSGDVILEMKVINKVGSQEAASQASAMAQFGVHKDKRTPAPGNVSGSSVRPIIP